MALSLPLVPERLPPERFFPADDPGFSARHVTTAEGWRLRVVEAAGPGSDGPPLLLLHGWGCSAATWRRLMPRLAERGHRVLALDLPGHGLSDKPVQRHHYTREALAVQVLQAMDALAIDAAVLVGHSMGGAIVREVACAAPSRVAGAAFLAPAGFGRVRRLATGRLLSPDWVVPFLGPLAVPRFAIVRSLQRTWGPRGGFTERDVDEVWAPSQFPGFVRASRHLIHHFGWEPPAPAALAPLLAVPRTFLLAGHDRLLVSHDIAEYAAHLPGSEVEWLPQAGHALHEDSPDEVARHLAGWLGRVPAPPRGARA